MAKKRTTKARRKKTGGKGTRKGVSSGAPAEVETEVVPVEPAADEALEEPTAQELGEAKLEPPPVSQSSTALSLRDPFQAYLHEVQRYPLLTATEEKELTRAYADTGDPAVARRLIEAMSELSEHHQEILALRHAEGLSYAEIAQRLEIPRGTVMSRLYHAREALRKKHGL